MLYTCTANGKEILDSAAEYNPREKGSLENELCQWVGKELVI